MSIWESSSNGPQALMLPIYHSALCYIFYRLRCLPNLYIIACRGNTCSIGGSDYRIDRNRTDMTMIGKYASSSSRTPDLYCCIIAGRSNPRSIRGPGHCINLRGMVISGNMLSRDNIPVNVGIKLLEFCQLCWRELFPSFGLISPFLGN
jgi:hypothetical protein